MMGRAEFRCEPWMLADMLGTRRFGPRASIRLDGDTLVLVFESDLIPEEAAELVRETEHGRVVNRDFWFFRPHAHPVLEA